MIQGILAYLIASGAHVCLDSYNANYPSRGTYHRRSMIPKTSCEYRMLHAGFIPHTPVLPPVRSLSLRVLIIYRPVGHIQVRVL